MLTVGLAVNAGTKPLLRNDVLAYYTNCPERLAVLLE